MEFILDSIDAACDQGALLPALFTALTIPDIAGAVDEPGAFPSQRYPRWIDTFFVAQFAQYTTARIDGHVIYALRCQLLHEGLTDPSKASAAKKSPVGAQKRLIAFSVDPLISAHLVSMNMSHGPSLTCLRAEQFCQEITTAARHWISLRQSDPQAMQKLRSLVDYREWVPGLGDIPCICAEVPFSWGV